jgi:hypothetical protein
MGFNSGLKGLIPFTSHSFHPLLHITILMMMMMMMMLTAMTETRLYERTRRQNNQLKNDTKSLKREIHLHS